MNCIRTERRAAYVETRSAPR